MYDVIIIGAGPSGIMTAYVHYLLVRPEYHDLGIGKHLVNKVKDIYKDYLRIVVIGYDEEVGFYENCGFEKSQDSSPLFITDLWTWGVTMIDNEDIFNKMVGLVNLNDAHFKVLVDNQNLILKNQEILSKQLNEINEKLDKLME